METRGVAVHPSASKWVRLRLDGIRCGVRKHAGVFADLEPDATTVRRRNSREFLGLTQSGQSETEGQRAAGEYDTPRWETASDRSRVGRSCTMELSFDGGVCGGSSPAVDRGDPGPNQRGEILSQQRRERLGEDGVAGGIASGSGGTFVSVGETGSGSDALRRPKLPGSDATPDSVDGDVGLRVVAHGEAEKKNAQLTMEQVCRALNVRSGEWLRRQRGTSEGVYTLEVIRYHQARNATAEQSRRKRNLLELKF